MPSHPSAHDTAPTILVVNDDPGVLALYSHLLSFDCRILIARALAEARALLLPVGNRVTLVLMDVDLPDGNAIDFLQEIHPLLPESAPLFVFQSTRDDMACRLRAYHAGAYDYLPKHLAPEELLTKVHTYLRSTLAHQDGRVKNLREPGFPALSHPEAEQIPVLMPTPQPAPGHEIGLILQGMQHLCQASSFAEIARTGVAIAGQWQLKAIVQIHPQSFSDHSLFIGEPVTCNPQGVASPLECALITHSRLSGRLYPCPPRLIINGNVASIMVTNLPQAAEAAARARDNLMILTDTLDAKVQMLMDRAMIQEKTSRISDAQARLQDVLALRHSTLADQAREIQVHLQGFMPKLEALCRRLKLESPQASALQQFWASESQAVLDLLDTGEGMDNALGRLARALSG